MMRCINPDICNKDFTQKHQYEFEHVVSVKTLALQAQLLSSEDEGMKYIER